MLNLKLKFLYLFLLLIFSGCAFSVHQFHAGDFHPYPRKNKVVSAHAKQFVVLGFTDNTNYVDQALNQLMNSCRGGNIVGPTTEFMTELGFFSWTNHIYMQGSCVKN